MGNVWIRDIIGKTTLERQETIVREIGKYIGYITPDNIEKILRDVKEANKEYIGGLK